MPIEPSVEKLETFSSFKVVGLKCFYGKVFNIIHLRHMQYFSSFILDAFSCNILFFLWVKSSELALKVLASHMQPVGMYSF